MEIPNDLPLPAYYKLCDKIEKRINNIQFLSTTIFTKEDYRECDELRHELVKVKIKLGEDTREKIREDIKRLYEVVSLRVNQH